MASESASDSATTGVGSTSALGIREIIQTTRNNEIWKDFNMCIMTNDVEEGVFNDEVGAQNEATQLTDQEIALDASSDGSLSSGERRRDYMMSSGAEDDQTGEGGSMSHGYTYY
ncbi:hypothetical protein Tco_0971336 [Tanacetum coccineum]